MKTELIPFPNTFTEQPYAAIPDKNQNVWAPLWTTDQIAKYDSKAGTWTMFDLPTRGTEIRIASLLERGNDLKIVFAYARSSKVAVMAVRSEAELASRSWRCAARPNWPRSKPRWQPIAGRRNNPATQ